MSPSGQRSPASPARGENHMTPRTRVTAILVALVGSIAAGALALASSPPAAPALGSSPAAAPPPAAIAQRDAGGLLGLVGVDHVGITVPDIDQAVAWFQDVMGCSTPLTFGPFADPTGTF